MDAVKELAAIAADWRHRPLDADVEWAARRALLDWFATTLPGCVQPPATLLAGALASQRGTGGAWCYVDGRPGTARHAALINAVASHTVEFDDIFRDGGYHPGSPTVAAALALAQDRGLPLERFHRALIAGYEVGCRVSLAIQPSHYVHWHITSTVGTIGAAVAGAVLLDCDATAIGHAIGLATSFAGGHQQNLQGEGMAKAMHPGHAADAGLLAAFAAAAGVTAAPGALDGAKGYAAATSDSTGDWDAALEGGGQWTPITRMTVKNHGCCGHIFPALDGLRAIMEAEALSPDDIASIMVEGYAATAQMCDRPTPVSAQEARFSLQYCLAAQMLTGAVRLAAFEPETLARADIRALMQRIAVTEAPDLSAAYPRRRMARLAVRLHDGREIHHTQHVRKGDPEAPLTNEEIIQKYEELAASVLSEKESNRLMDIILNQDFIPREVNS
ncbi:MmgE/PrpD family protein [Azospirillum sp. B2RO_4]|uniref:MmgE/PrpD family protein n=1 Tax=Azospirillum sp. B2RO_4 TaxID=3027796 RepID=UPI003DA9CE79